MLAFFLDIILMILALFFIKNRIVVFVLWFLCCFMPFFLYVYEWEQGDIEKAQSMGESIFISYFQIFYIAFVWMGGEFLISFVCYKILKFLFQKLGF